AADGHQQAVAAQLRAVAELEYVFVAAAAGGGGVLAELELDALRGERLPHALAHRPGLTGEQMVVALHERHLRSHPAHRLRHLHAHRTAAEDQEAPRYLLEAGRLAVGPDAVELAQPV